MKIAYLDISPRQTGKTSRLIEIADGITAQDRRVCYVTSKGMKKHIQAALPRALVLADGEAFPAGENPAASIWFYDEFDWLKSTELRAGAFYATTPRFARKLGEHTPDNDLLLRLVQANGSRYERNTWSFEMADTIREVRQILSPEQFLLLYLGEFLQ